MSLVYLLLILLGAYFIYHVVTSKEERKKYRTKIQKQILERQSNIQEKSNQSDFQKRIKKTGLPITAYAFQIVRWLFIIIIMIYYFIVPIIEGKGFQIIILPLAFVMILFTEPRFQYSLTNLLIGFLINRKRRHMITEMFTLFDILKTELLSFKVGTEVNVYYILKEALPLFEHINGSIAKFIYFWRSNPEKARGVFVEDIGGESAKVLGDILFKMDKTSRKNALQILESEAEVFSFQYYETELQHSGKQRLFFYFLFMGTNVLIIAWLILLVLSMFSNSLQQTNINF